MKRFSIFDFRLKRGESQYGAPYAVRRLVAQQAEILSYKQPAFTIIELLVSMAVLAIILVMLVNVVSGLGRSTQMQSQQMNSASAARLTLDVMAMDLQNAIIGENATILAPAPNGGSKILSLVTSRRGPVGSSSPRFLAVSYSTMSNQIFRSYGSVNFTETNLIAVALNASTVPVEPLAKNILAIQIRAVTDSTNFPIDSVASANWATANYNGVAIPSGYQAILTRSPAFAYALTNCTRAIEIWIAAIDEQSANVIPSTYRPTNIDPAMWRAEIDAAAIPSQAKTGVRILNKIIPLP